MTPAQLASVKSFITGDATLNAFPNNPDGNFEIAAALNLAASPTFWVWRNAVPVSEIMGNGFAWDRVDNMSVSKSRIWEFMTVLGSLNPSQPNVRAGIIAAFPAVSLDLAMRQAIFNHCQRAASRVEKLLATGAGTTVTEQGTGPGTAVFEGSISYIDVEVARNLP